MKKFALLVLGLVVVPSISFAATTISGVLLTIINYLNIILPALITIAVIYFIWGVISFIMSSEEDAKKKGKTKIINGLIGLFVIVAFWGIIAVVKNSFQITNDPQDGVVPYTPTMIPNND